MLVLCYSVDAFPVFTLGGELAVEASLNEDAVMVDGHHQVRVRPVGSDVSTRGYPEYRISCFHSFAFLSK